MNFRQTVVPWAIHNFYRLWSGTWNFQVIEPPDLKERLKNKEPTVFAHFHGDELVLLKLIGPYRVATMVSTSKDGEIMNAVVERVGGVTSRGSSTRGSVSALKGLLRLMKTGRNTSMAVDGPKGPIFKVKPGVFEIARMTRAPIYWCGISYSDAIQFEKSWNKTYLPKPFSKVRVEWHGPIYIGKDQSPRDPAQLELLERELKEARSIAFKNIVSNDAKC